MNITDLMLAINVDPFAALGGTIVVIILIWLLVKNFAQMRIRDLVIAVVVAIVVLVIIYNAVSYLGENGSLTNKGKEQIDQIWNIIQVHNIQ